MSFALTTPQMQAGEKDLTRRLGWKDLKPGTVLQPIEKGQGLKKGQTVYKITRPIRVVSVRREALNAITKADVVREGFPTMSPLEFVTMFCQHNRGCTGETEVTRIEFTFVAPKPRLACVHGNDRDLCTANSCNGAFSRHCNGTSGPAGSGHGGSLTRQGSHDATRTAPSASSGDSRTCSSECTMRSDRTHSGRSCRPFKRAGLPPVKALGERLVDEGRKDVKTDGDR